MYRLLMVSLVEEVTRFALVSLLHFHIASTLDKNYGLKRFQLLFRVLSEYFLLPDQSSLTSQVYSSKVRGSSQIKISQNGFMLLSLESMRTY